MKKEILTALLLLSSIIYSQTIPEGNYISTKKGENFKLHINPDNTFEMSVFHGKVVQKKDSIFFDNESLKTQHFEILKSEKKSIDNIQLSFTEDSYISYYYDKIYIGTQENENSTIEFKSLSEYMPGIATQYDTKTFSLSIEKCKYFYLVHEVLDKESYIYKFTPTSNNNSYEIKYNAYSGIEIKLFAFYDPKSKELKLTDGKSPMVFVPEGEIKNQNSSSQIIASSVETIKNWSYTGKKDKQTETNSIPTDSYAQTTEDKPKFQFHLKIEKTFKNAISNNKNGKYTIVVIDPSKDAKTKFQNFITQYENYVTSYMYEEYRAEYDKFNFYLANSSDKEIKKYGNSNNSTLFFYNDKGNLLYHEKGTNYDNSEIIYSANQITNELLNADLEAQIDNCVTLKLTSKEKKEILHNFIKSYTKSNNNNITTDIAPPVVDSTIKTNKENIKVVEAVVDTTAVVSIPDYDYSILKEKNNFYKTKSNAEEVRKLWKTTFLEHENKPFDIQIALVGIKELQDSGVANILFNEQTNFNEEFNFKVLQYLTKNIDKIEEVISSNEYYNSTYINVFDARNDIMRIIEENFLNSTSSNKATMQKSLELLKNLIRSKSNDYYTIKRYLDALKKLEMYEQYFIAYDSYFTSIITNSNQSIIEQLDTNYSLKENRNEDWNTFKSNFSYYANESAWLIVEKSLQKIANVSKAIRWSETSLAIEKNNGYYLDTLAQLYYLNGEKQKAIETQEKAVANFVVDNDPETFEKMKVVLEKMKNGTY